MWCQRFEWQKTNVDKNLTKPQFRAINELKNNEHIVIRQSDKGGCIVVLDKELYVSLVLSILRDETTYRRLSSDPTTIFQRSLNTLLEEGFSLGVLSDRLY